MNTITATWNPKSNISVVPIVGKKVGLIGTTVIKPEGYLSIYKKTTVPPVEIGVVLSVTHIVKDRNNPENSGGTCVVEINNQ